MHEYIEVRGRAVVVVGSCIDDDVDCARCGGGVSAAGEGARRVTSLVTRPWTSKKVGK